MHWYALAVANASPGRNVITTGAADSALNSLRLLLEIWSS